MILGTAMLITIVGLASVLIRRVRMANADQTGNFARARMLAFSGAEHAAARLAADTMWRDTYDGVTVTQDSGGGTFSWQVIDPADGDLTDDITEAAQIVSTGTYDGTSYTLTMGVTITAASPIEALGYAILSGGNTEVKDGKTVTVTGAPLGTNGNAKVKDGATLNADVDAGSFTLEGTGVIVGTATTLSDSVAMPDAGLFDTYKALATTITVDCSGKGGGKIEKFLLSPSNNPWGSTNSDGVYFIDTANGDLTINKARIYGTLLIDPGSGKVKLGGKSGTMLMQSFRSDYPTLMVNGRLEAELESATRSLTESDAGTNLNPTGSPYEGVTDSDTSDSYPSEIRGLVHTFGETKLKKTTIIRGILICEDKIRFEGDAQIIYDSSLYDNPPDGYSTGSGQTSPGAWTRQIE